eukprot:scaffold45178_cov45-Prasinocladus_malaysianus.AAC.1
MWHRPASLVTVKCIDPITPVFFAKRMYPGPEWVSMASTMPTGKSRDHRSLPSPCHSSYCHGLYVNVHQGWQGRWLTAQLAAAAASSARPAC